MNLSRVGDWLGDAINPIVVKELRQAVNSRFLTFSLILFFAVQLVAMGIYIFGFDLQSQMNSYDREAGRQAFTILQFVLLATCLIFLPANAGSRLGSERSDVNVDLMFVTTLSPLKIIGGKLAASLILAITIFSAASPFMVFTYFLRGLDLPLILFILLIDFIIVVGAVTFCIFLASITTNRLAKALLALVAIVCLLFVYGFSVNITMAMLQFMSPRDFSTPEFWSIVGLLLFGCIAWFGLLYIWSVALISPPSSNRTMPMRVYIFFTWLIAGIGMVVWSIIYSIIEPITIWIIGTTVLLNLCLVISICERVSWSPRISRKIPRGVLRPLAFLFYSGAAGGILFCVLLYALTMFVSLAWYGFASPHLKFGVSSLGGSFRYMFGPSHGYHGIHSYFFGVVRGCSIWLLYMYCYAMTAVCLRKVLFPAIAAKMNWFVMLLTFLFFSLVPYLIGFFIFYRRFLYSEHFYWSLSNPIVGVFEATYGTDYDRRSMFILFAIAWGALITVVNGPWTASQISRFRPHESDVEEEAVLITSDHLEVAADSD